MKEYFNEARGKVYAILNHKYRKGPDDVVVAMRLRAQELEVYNQLRGAGKTDSVIFRRLFPGTLEGKADAHSHRIPVSIRELNKRQLVHLILEELKVNLPSLPRLSIRDLRRLLVAVRAMRRS